MRALPRGTVTFLFTDIEGSTRLLDELGGERYATVLAEHHRVCREAWEAHSGVEVDTEGDAFFVVFERAADALAAAEAAQKMLERGPVRVRIGVHTGEVLVTETGYVGRELHRAARIAASGHGGQIVLSNDTRELAGDGFALVELGEHRFKDFDEPVPLFQLGEGRFPPLKTVSNTNLPRPASSFVGRERELAEVLDRVEQGARLVTLTGPGGSGKTRLALETAASLVPDFKAGVFWVGLAALRDPALVTESIAQTLGAKDGLAEHIGGREMLLLLDNLEQVIDAAPELGALLASCANLRLLVTSRELLRVQGELEYPVPPLAESEAVELFCARAQMEPSSDIEQLCARLDDLPLAVELAAARTKALSPGQILARLGRRLDLLKGGRDADPRQQTLRATIAWSHDLLSADEQRLFCRLAVFSGGCTLEAAEHVCEADLDTLQSLVEKSLLRFTNERYWMLETIREFAGERLDATGHGDSLRARHASFFKDFAVQAEPRLRTRDLLTWFDRFRAELDNIRAALDFLEQQGDASAHARLAGACWYFWYLGGHFREGLERLESAFARADELSPANRAVLHDGLDVFNALLGRPKERIAHAKASLAIRRRLGEPAALLRSLLHSAGAAESQEHRDEARELYRECMELARAEGDEWFQAVASGNLGWMMQGEGKYDLARSIGADALALAEQVGDPFTVRALAMDLAFAEVELGMHESAAPRMRRVAEECADGRTPELLVWALGGLATVEAEVGEARRAARLMGAAEATALRISYEIHRIRQEKHERALAIMHGRLGDRDLEAVLRAGRELSEEDAIAYAVAPEGVCA